jgi:hypothetical protein
MDPLTDSLPSDGRQTLGKEVTSLSSVLGDTWQRHRLRHPGAMTAAFLCRVPSGTRQSLCRVPKKKYSTKSVPSAREKNTRQRRLCRCTVRRALFAECDTRQRLCRVLQALGKAPDSGSASCMIVGAILYL